jgi:diaminohydroxyphosphoribosylaminopyrimidine deaminase/5-amino-6-(5-phosphoribosylamino)uracil reductase
MRMALDLAKRGWYTARPNPRVGCVLVKGGEAVGSGWHERTGEAHAEVKALQHAGHAAQGATAYISLEPCAHHGHTPPCCNALIEAGISRAVIATSDPNPQVSGKGTQALLAAGIEVVEGVLQEQADHMNAGFMKRQRTGMPRIILKLAMSMDGRIAMHSGESRWISSPAARADVQDMRAASCAILTGIGTIIADDPRFTVRGNEWHPVYEYKQSNLPQPLVVVADSSLRLPEGAGVRSLGEKLLIAYCLGDADQNEQTSWRAPSKAGKIDLCALLKHLAERRQINNILAECGGTLAAALLADGLVDEFCFYMAPKILGSTARSAIELPLEKMQDTLNFTIVECIAVGKDLRVRAIPNDRV